MSHFRITGLPRSKTALLSTIFTWGTSFCYHEFFGNKTIPKGFDHIGISDPALLFMWEKESHERPDMRWVVVVRDVEESHKSISRIDPEITFDQVMSAKAELDRLMWALHPLIVSFDDTDAEMCREIAKYLGIDIGPIERVRQLCDMNIQIHPPILKKRLEQLKNLQAA